MCRRSIGTRNQGRLCRLFQRSTFLSKRGDGQARGLRCQAAIEPGPCAFEICVDSAVILGKCLMAGMMRNGSKDILWACVCVCVRVKDS